MGFVQGASVPFDFHLPGGGPGGGIDLPIGGGAGQVCPPGTSCNGPSIQGPFGFALCLGQCSAFGEGGFDPGGGGGGGGGDPLGAHPHCTSRLADICRTSRNLAPHTLGDCNGCNFEIAPQFNLPSGGGGGGNGRNGSGCACGARTSPSKACACCLPDGGTGKLNKSRYYQFGDCRRGTSAGVVEKGTKCVSKRHINFGNGRASRRAITRLNGAVRQLRDIERLAKGIGRARRRRR